MGVLRALRGPVSQRTRNDKEKGKGKIKNKQKEDDLVPQALLVLDYMGPDGRRRSYVSCGSRL